MEQISGENHWRLVLRREAAGITILWAATCDAQATLPDTLLLLDSIDPATGEALELPTVHPAQKWLAMIAAEAENEGVGFSIENMYLVFDENGVPAVACRYYVPWQ